MKHHVWQLFGWKIKIILMISIHFKNNLISNYLQSDDFDFNVKLIFKA